MKTSIPTKSKKSTEHVICRDLIELLWQENWFNGERNLSEVDEELSRRGYHYDKCIFAAPYEYKEDASLYLGTDLCDE